MPAEKVRVQYYEGSGTFGRSCYEDAAQAAAIMSQAVGRPVRVQFMRWDEHGWDNYGPAHLAEVRAGVDANGKLVAYEYHGWQHGWTVTSTVLRHRAAEAGRRARERLGLDHRQPDEHRLDVPGRRTGASSATPCRWWAICAARRCARRSICRSRSPPSRPSTSLRTRSRWTRSSSGGRTSATSAGSACSTRRPRPPSGSRG